MGNRAIITSENKNMGVYLHWNGGRDSVEAFLEYCRLKGFRSPEEDENYAFARLTQIVSNFFGGSLSVGIVGKCNDKICSDNGNYIVGNNWSIVDREYPCKDFIEQDDYDLKEMLESIDNAQPIGQQLREVLYAKEKNVENLRKGDVVFILNYDGVYEKYKVIGFGDDKFVNGENVLNKPYIDKYENEGNYADNINNYILTDRVRVYEENRVNKKEISEEMEV